MPQMAPLPWVTLLIMTIIILFCLTSMIFFSIQEKKMKKTFEWKNMFFIKW
uniref:ATP synthase complex subunit 8 n=1 Tax=Arytainilla spartiophila TaxID=178948 RepID=A0A344A256_ARYSP|nr:ATP synthase F0 subunit 8 [Arytainilla spartiophila]AWU48847.1 ATP synthase F0 subunit 8 [Arytainilla spartiophila]